MATSGDIEFDDMSVNFVLWPARFLRTETDPHEALHRSVAWHLAHPHEGASDDFGADDRALAAAV
jgi:hypothetical protein